MPYVATVLRVMIASPSDVPGARDTIENAIHKWNAVNSHNRQIVLVPWRWETSAVPTTGDHPQAIINSQGLDDADIVFGLFWGRLGSPTPDAVSGTVEEIDRSVKAGKAVHLYFSKAALPSDVDLDQLRGLRDFKKELQDRSLLGEYDNDAALEFEVWKCIEADITVLSPALPAPGTPPGTVTFVVQPGQENLVSYNGQGRPSNRRNTWVDITNTGTTDAERVEYEVVGETSGLHVGGRGDPTVIHAGQTRRLPTMYTLGGAGDPVLRVKWIEDGEEKFKDFHVG